MPGVLASESKFKYLIEISCESTCAFGLKHLGTNM